MMRQQGLQGVGFKDAWEVRNRMPARMQWLFKTSQSLSRTLEAVACGSRYMRSTLGKGA